MWNIQEVSNLSLGLGSDTAVLVSIACILATFTCLGISYTEAKTAITENSSGETTQGGIEDDAMPVKEGDAKVSSKLVIDNDFIDPDNNCEFCTRMVYTPGSIKQAGIAYKDDTVDLGNAQRVVFFAMGAPGQDVSFVAAGNDTRARTANDTDVFSRIDFAVATDNVTVKNYWQRFEIGLNGTALSDASYPFGIQMTTDSSKRQTFFIKGVTIDSKPAQNPLPTEFDSLTNSTQPLTVKIDANSSKSSAPATIEFAANATGGLAPYSLLWDFGDDSNDTDIDQKVSHTFEIPGDYNITLAAKDSGNPSQNASATMLITVIPVENKTASALSNVIIAYANSTSFAYTNATASMVDTNNTDSSPPASILMGMNSTLASTEQNSSQIQLKSADQFTKSIDENITVNHNNTSNVEVINHAPVAGDQIVVLDANETASVVLKGSDQDDDPITFDLTTDPLRGTITGFDKKTGSLTYIPDSRSPGRDSFTFTVIDIHGAESNPGRVLETVNSVQPLVHSALTTADVSVATTRNDPVTIILMATPEQETDRLKISLAASPSHGKLSELTSIDQKSARVTYYPEEGYSGNDIFKFNVDDLSTGGSTSGKVSITVFAAPPGANSPTVASAQNVETDTSVDSSGVNSPGVATAQNAEIDQNKKMIRPDTHVDSPSVSKRIDAVTSQNLTGESLQEPSQEGRRVRDEPGQTATQATNLINHDPSAHAGLDRTVYESTNDITLKGAGKDPDGDRLSYSWEQTAGDPIVVLVDANTAKPKFDAPEFDEDKVLIFRLTIADGNGGQATDSVRITIKDKLVIDNQFVPEQTRPSQVMNRTSTSGY